ncbi:MAG: Stk1 family PASTA domain-containing Ser/Thr kinase [Syntrophomonadaceae bacterium]|nr:Stk1 family PASTA domain-containing Ser/Thr kinase [Syntrophomonadaceae bacterium]
MLGRILAGRYELLEKLGGGGMAVVYKGKDRLLNRAVTVKLLRDQYAHDQEFVRKFRREAQAVASLSHPNIVSIYDVGQEGDLHYLVMEYVEGKSLRTVIQEEGALEPSRAVELSQQICEALHHAHEHQIIHRDIKPHNILITRNGRAKVTDFGIALAASTATVTYEGNMVGSVHYVSPEQARGEPTTPQSDVYSAGIVLYEMLTGEVPFIGETPIGIAMKHVQESPRPPRDIRPEIPPALERVVAKALIKDLSRRYKTANEMWADLEKIRLILMGEDMPAKDFGGVGGDKMKDNTGPRRRRKARPLAWVLFFLIILAGLYATFLGFAQWFVIGETRVPDVVDLPLYQAQLRLNEAGLKTEVGEKRHHLRIVQGNVISQSQEPDTVIKKGRTIRLDLSLGPELREVPDVTGETVRMARTRLQNAEFVVDPNEEQVFHPDIPPGRVINTDPQPLTRQPRGSTIKLIVSAGPQLQEVTMPNLIGRYLDEVRKDIDALGLFMNLTYTDSPHFFAGQVAAQEPAPDSPVTQGTTVNLVISKGGGPPAQPATVTVPVPNDGKQHQVSIVVSDRKSTRTEYSQRHSGGDYVQVVVAYYGEGVVQVFLNDEKIYERRVP